MRGLWKLILIQAKLYLREPQATFFTIFFAPMMLLIFGAIYGNKPNPHFGGRGTIDISVPAYIGLIIASVGMIGVPIGISTARERGILKRFRATPLHPLGYIIGDIVSYLIMTMLGISLLILMGKAIFNVRFEGNLLSVMAGLLLGTLNIFSLGYLIAGLAPTARIAQTAGMFLAFPMMFLSGATIPLEVMPDKMQAFSRFIPLTHVVKLMKGLWFGEPWSQHLVEVTVLIGILVIAGAIAALSFRWE